MLRICKSLILRSFLQPRVLILSSHEAGMKQSIEEKLGLPARPKRPLSPYFRFLTKVRPVIAQKNPDAKVTDIAKMVSEQWTKADPEVRKQIEGEYRREFDLFTKQLEEYKNNLTEVQKQQIIDAKVEIKEKKEKLELKKKIREMGRPKKPGSAFMTYLTEQLRTRKEREPFREFQQKIAKEWANMNEKAKEIYLNNSTKQMETYKLELQKWEEKMIRLGHIDVVRNEALIEPPPGYLHKKLQRVKKEK